VRIPQFPKLPQSTTVVAQERSHVSYKQPPVSPPVSPWILSLRTVIICILREAGRECSDLFPSFAKKWTTNHFNSKAEKEGMCSTHMFGGQEISQTIHFSPFKKKKKHAKAIVQLLA
jgi:hypothetical protein